jgi:probable F420-dependent oxidoreductase
MRLGFALPQFGRLGTQPGAATEFAREAEALGADSLWVSDRLMAPVHPVIGYAGTDTIPVQFRTPMDPFALLAAAAAVTQRARLGASVLNAPFYPPATLARSLASIDVLSGGRLIAGFGLGWCPEEFEAVGVPMKQRGARLDECLDAFGSLWSQDVAQHHGEHWDMAESYTGLKPVQQPRLPVYLGGYTPAAMHRVARRADGWLPVVEVPGRFPPDLIRQALAGIRAEAERLGRDPGQIDAILRINGAPSATPAQLADAVVAASEQAGIDHSFVDLMYMTEDTGQALDFAAQVISQVRQVAGSA